jgi:predicted polyphosphate/ATP-dependent NAD kinase
VAILGIPTGVKMHSAVFATSPENAGLLANAAAHGWAEMRDGELVDRDEAGALRFHGVARIPYERRRVQQAKRAGRPPDAALQGACAEIASSLAPGGVALFGPGTTTQRVLAQLGIEGSVYGVDAVSDGALLGRDLTEAAILRLITGRSSCAAPARIIVGVVGGQGCLFGRGNQQFSPAVIRMVGTDRITIIADAEKILALAEGALFVDTGDVAVDALLSGYRRVHTGPGQSLLIRVLA